MRLWFSKNKDEYKKSDCHGRPQKFFQVGSKVDVLLLLFRLLTMQRKWMYTTLHPFYTTKKMPNVTATVARSVFPLRANVWFSEHEFFKTEL